MSRENPSTPRSTDPEGFLVELFDPFDDWSEEMENDPGHVAIWTDRDRRTTLHPTPQHAAEYADDPLAGYVGSPFYMVGTRNLELIQERAKYQRCGLNTLRGNKGETLWLPAVWADVDFAKEGSPKTYPPDEAAAMEAVRACIPYTPTLTVWTGGGVHLLWVFRGGFVGADLGEDLCRSLQAAIRHAFKTHGWEIDSTHDCTRALRLPGFVHPKYPDAGLVSWEKTGEHVSCDGLMSALQVEEAEEPELIPAGHAPDTRQLPGLSTRFVLTPPRELENDLAVKDVVDLMCSSDPDVFGRTWARRNRQGDTSQSGRDLSLACAMVRDGIGPQMVIDVIRWHRLSASRGIEVDKDKAARVDYYERTLARAHEFIGEEVTAAAAVDAAEARTESVVVALETAKVEEKAAEEGEAKPEVTEEVRESGLGLLGMTLGLADGLQITVIYRTPSETPNRDLYLIHFGKAGAVSLSASTLVTPTTLRQALPMGVGGSMASWKMDAVGKARWFTCQRLIRSLAIGATDAAAPERHAVCQAIVETSVSLYLDYDGALFSCRSEDWYHAVVTNQTVAWVPARGDDRTPAVLVPLARLRHELTAALPREGLALVKPIFGTEPGFETVNRVSIPTAQGSRTKSGYVRVRMTAIGRLGGEEMETHVRRVIALAEEETSRH